MNLTASDREICGGWIADDDSGSKCLRLELADDVPADDCARLRITAVVERAGGVEQRPVRSVNGYAEQVGLLASADRREPERPAPESEVRVDHSSRRVDDRHAEVADRSWSGLPAIQCRDIHAID